MGRDDATTTSSTTSRTEGARRELAPAPLLGPGEWIAGRYRVEGLLGRGGFGEVYRVRDAQQDGRPLALKLHRARRLARAALTALRSEFGLLSTLAHPHLAAVHDFAYVPGEYAYFTETLVEGTPLHDAGVDPTTPAGAALLVQLCRALDYLHARGIVHGDVKPSNVLCDPSRTHLTLVDFGVARALGADVDGPLAGSPPFLAPELVTGGAGDARSDLYALGITLYQLVAGRPPFRGPKNDVLAMQVEASPPDLSHATPLPLRTLIARLLAKDPDDRPASAAHVVADLARVGGLEDARVDTDETLASHLHSASVVGRVPELFELSALAEGAAAGPRAVLVVGAPGAGKTRLVGELRRRAQLRGQPWIQTDVRRGRGDLLPRLARALLDRPTRAALSEESRIELARALPELRRARERIALPVDPARALERRLVVLADALAARFASSAGVLAVEDLHFASSSELEALAAFLGHVRRAGARCLFVGTAREDAAERLHGIDAERMECPPLRPRAARELLEATLGDPVVLEGTALGAQLAEAPSGALWLQESLRDAIERGALVRRAARFVRLADVEARPLPEILASRLARRSAPARRLALGLAILDEPEAAHALVRVSGLSRRRGLEALAELVRAGLVERRAEGAHARYAMQERYAQAILEATPARAVRAARQRVGHYLAARRGVDFRGLAHAAGVLEAAGDEVGAVAALARAADLAAAQGRPEHAVRLLAREVALRAEGDPMRAERLLAAHDLAVRAGIAEAAGTSLMDVAHAAAELGDPRIGLAVAIRGARQALGDGDLDDARATSERVLAQASAEGLHALACEAAILCAEVEQALGAIERALARYDDAAERARGLGRADLEATAALGAALLHVRRGDRRASEDAARRAVAAADRSGDPILRSEAHRALGNARLAGGRRPLAAASYRAAVRVARASGGIVPEGKALNNLASVALSLGRALEALEAWERAIDLKERAGAIPSAMVTWASMTGALALLGRREEARAAQQRVIDSPRTDHPVAVAVAWSNRGDLELLEGDCDAAIAAFDRAADAYEALALEHLRTHGLAGGARARLARGAPGDLEGARAKSGELDAIAAHTRSALDRRRALTTRALVLDASGAPEVGLPLAREAARITASDGVYEDALASTVEAAWIVALLLHRAGRPSGPAMARARRRLEARAERLDPSLRAPFTTQHPLHVCILGGAAECARGTTWPVRRGAGVP